MGYGAILKFLARYWLHLAVLATVAVLGAWFYSWAHGNGANEERAKWLTKENKALTQAVAERDRAIADRNAAQRKADELAKPKAKVAESVRTNPSKCVLPAPVADAARVQVDAVNDAIRAHNAVR